MSKRRRTESDVVIDGGEGSEPVVRSSIWLEDGNVVLQVDSMQFKVHRGVLKRVSTIFSDMFSLPQPTEVDGAVEGCPVVHLRDTTEDVECLLSILYD